MIQRRRTKDSICSRQANKFTYQTPAAWESLHGRTHPSWARPGILLEGGGQKFLNRDPDSVPLLIVASLGKKKSKTTTREGETGHLSLVGMGYWKGGELVLVG